MARAAQRSSLSDVVLHSPLQTMSGCWPSNRGTIHQLIYASTLVDVKDVEHVLADIMSTSFRNDPYVGITGVLSFDSKTREVHQVLEGPKRAVLALFANIQGDARSEGCRIISQTRRSARLHDSFGLVVAISRRDTDEGTSQLSVARRQSLVAGLRLEYTSNMKAAAGGKQFQEDVRDILCASVANTSKNEVGGLLCINPETGAVVHVLEGPVAAVNALYTQIQKDDRHMDIRTVSEEELPSTNYCSSKWSMLPYDTTEETDMPRLSLLLQRQQSRTIRLSKESLIV